MGVVASELAADVVDVVDVVLLLNSSKRFLIQIFNKYFFNESFDG